MLKNKNVFLSVKWTVRRKVIRIIIILKHIYFIIMQIWFLLFEMLLTGRLFSSPCHKKCSIFIFSFAGNCFTANSRDSFLFSRNKVWKRQKFWIVNTSFVNNNFLTQFVFKSLSFPYFGRSCRIGCSSPESQALEQSSPHLREVFFEGEFSVL